MTSEQLEQQIRKKRSFLCVGLDTDLEKVPAHLLEEEDPIFAFNKAIIDATRHLCVAYKPNTAFYEAYGAAGWKSLERTIAYLNETCPDHFTIADAKRGDIGNTSTRYARAFFDTMDFDALTVAPYMGRDSVEPFLAFDGKFVILLALTSNPGAFDFQTGASGSGPLFETVLAKSREYAGAERLMYVVGATKAEYLAEIRKIVPESFLLIPGIGAQGGSLREVCRYGMTDGVGLLVNSSRGIIYAGRGADFADRAAEAAAAIQKEMSDILSGT
ncbi:orotidine-5'-phosphate decarboxylase [Robiginitalea sp. SC105]|uniref:orotidine-5'-phosphate decarboxylase n=1 Tax=Robiginitalea sp. SC105 TaxID=2762332 RepID=UPI00163AC5CC|nr:orotidine-5'-phosphate decarboxylase [Robiginitalea sp. SC105]MBC2839880.1 orotidine-5'-phosphate decarboxylase [Robiginitalea sp. SC105]